MDNKQYKEKYDLSITDPEKFWATEAIDRLDWFKQPTQVLEGSLTKGSAQWFRDGVLNVSYNCIDRHIQNGKGNKIAYLYESDNGSSVQVTYDDLLLRVSKLANVLKSLGVRKGDRVCIYMPSTPEAIYAMLACTRIGAVHNVVFAGFSAEALAQRIQDAECKLLICSDVFTRGGKQIDLLSKVIEIKDFCESLEKVIVFSKDKSVKQQEHFVDYATEMSKACETCEPEHMSGEDPLFILYTSGSTGKPKGVLHTTAGYLLYVAMTHTINFDLRSDDIYWSVADIGWITGHSYLVYGPLVNGTTSVLFDGVPNFPDYGRHWEIVDKYRVTIYYTTPTIVRAQMRAGDSYLERSNRGSLRLLGTVGEPINPEAWMWLHTAVGKGNCTIVDTWWQTETGGHALVPIPGVVTPKPGAAMIPFFGIKPHIFDENGNDVQEPFVPGSLVLQGAWPGHLRDIYNDTERFQHTYLKVYPDSYYTGDAAFKDEDGHIWVTGRIDDVLNIAGRLIGTAEVESALVEIDIVSEAAAVAGFDDIKGSSIHCFVLIKDGETVPVNFNEQIQQMIRKKIGAFVKIDYVHVVDALPKTRSGKIMRRILRKIVTNNSDDLGDLSTLADSDTVESLLEYWKNQMLTA